MTNCIKIAILRLYGWKLIAKSNKSIEKHIWRKDGFWCRRSYLFFTNEAWDKQFKK